MHGGDTEVGEHRGAVGPQQDVGGLDVPVLDTGAVGGPQRGEDAPADPGRLRHGERAPGQAVGQAAAGHQLHDQPGVRVFGTVDDVVDDGDVRVLESGARPGLAQHPLAGLPRRVRIRRRHRRVERPDLLERDLAVQDVVPRPPDQAHPAAAQALQQFESAVDEPRVRRSSVHAGHRRRDHRRSPCRSARAPVPAAPARPWPDQPASAAIRKPMFPVELSGVFELRAPTR